jgi:type I restriction enzyme S subunit
VTSNNHHDLPNGWAYLFLKDITVDEKNAIKRGPFGSAIKKEYFQPSGYKVYEQQNAIYGNSELGKYFIGENKFKELQDFEVKPGDLIISCSGTIGKIAIVPENAPRGIINQALLKITLEKKIVFPKYFTYLFTSQAVQKNVLDKTRGTAIKNIASVKDLSKYLANSTN